MKHRIRIVFRDGQLLFPNHRGQVKLQSHGWLNYHIVCDQLGFVGYIPFQEQEFDVDQFPPNPDPRFIETHGYTGVLETCEGDGVHEIILPLGVYETVIKAITADVELKRAEWEKSQAKE